MASAVRWSTGTVERPGGDGRKLPEGWRLRPKETQNEAHAVSSPVPERIPGKRDAGRARGLVALGDRGVPLDRLNAVWQGAIAHVPYYRHLAAEQDLPPRFSSLAEFRSAVPVLPKSAVRAQPRAFLSERAHRGRWERTSGSTGTPMSIYWANDAHREMPRHLRPHGIPVGVRRRERAGTRRADGPAPHAAGRLATQSDSPAGLSRGTRRSEGLPEANRNFPADRNLRLQQGSLSACTRGRRDGLPLRIPQAHHPIIRNRLSSHDQRDRAVIRHTGHRPIRCD